MEPASLPWSFAAGHRQRLEEVVADSKFDVGRRFRRAMEGGGMFRVVKHRELAKDICELTVEAPLVVRNWRVGQFVVVRVHEGGERIPLSVAKIDRERGLVTLVVMRVGHTTSELCSLREGDAILDLLGPLGHPVEVGRYGTAVVVGGGVGVAACLPVAVALKEAGNEVIALLGFRTRELVFYEEEFRAVADEIHVTTDDGSYGRPGLVTEPLKEMLEAGRDIGFVYTVGPVPMMAAVADVTRPYGVKTVASLNPIMVDATGMCGACRVTVGGETKFACVDGPDFDAHQVDFRELAERLKTYDPRAVPRERCRLVQKIEELKTGRSG